MEKIKTVLMWYSGFGLLITFIAGITIANKTECTKYTESENILSLVLLAPILFYVFWEIYDSLKK